MENLEFKIKDCMELGRILYPPISKIDGLSLEEFFTSHSEEELRSLLLKKKNQQRLNATSAHIRYNYMVSKAADRLRSETTIIGHWLNYQK